jgi:hypothetical protein
MSEVPMRIRVLESIRINYRAKKITDPIHMTGDALHRACLDAVRDHPLVKKRPNWEANFPVGVGSNLVDTTRYWLSGDHYTLAIVLWNHGCYSKLSPSVLTYFQMANDIQNDALKMFAREIGSW